MTLVTYEIYGLRCASPRPLPGPRVRRPGPPDVALEPGEEADFRAARPRCRRRAGDWFRSRLLPDGSFYLCWTDNFEFLVSRDGRRIRYRPAPGVGAESLTNYLLSQVLSFSLLARGQEPLHGTVVDVGGAGVAFLGGCGAGKSSLAAEFLRRGFRLVTDDVVALEAAGAGFRIHPGIPRIKLFPSMARRLGDLAARGRPMVRGTSKLILPLGPTRVSSRKVPLRAIYVLAPPRRRGMVTVRPLPPRDAMLAVVQHTFNAMVTDRDRLERQFAFARDVVTRVGVRSLSYPRTRARLPEVGDAVLADLGGEPGGAAGRPPQSVAPTSRATA